MTLYKDITIKNFRGISELKLEGLKSVNVFLGRNNFGKTTILESVFLLSGMSNASLPSRVNTFRDPAQSFNPLGQIEYIFHNVQLQNKPTITGILTDKQYRSMCISLSDTKTIQGPIVRNGMLMSSEQKVKAICLSINSDYGTINSDGKIVNKRSFKCDFCTYENGQYSQDNVKGYQEFLSAQYIASDTSAFQISDELSSLIRANRKDDVLELVRLFDSRITNVEVLPDSTYIAFNGVDKLIPISMCGDGLKKFLYIISCVAGRKNKVLLIDEIDNGIHFSVYPLLWKSIINLAKKNEIQLMITTHSKEVLQELTNSINSENKDDVSVYTITKNKDDVMHSYRYDGENLKTAIYNHLELRD